MISSQVLEQGDFLKVSGREGGHQPQGSPTVCQSDWIDFCKVRKCYSPGMLRACLTAEGTAVFSKPAPAACSLHSQLEPVCPEGGSLSDLLPKPLSSEGPAGGGGKRREKLLLHQGGIAEGKMLLPCPTPHTSPHQAGTSSCLSRKLLEAPPLPSVTRGP